MHDKMRITVDVFHHEQVTSDYSLELGTLRAQFIDALRSYN